MAEAVRVFRHVNTPMTMRSRATAQDNEKVATRNKLCWSKKKKGKKRKETKEKRQMHLHRATLIHVNNLEK